MRPVLQSRWFWLAGLSLYWVYCVLNTFLIYVDHPIRVAWHPTVRLTGFHAVCFWAVGAMLQLHLRPLEWAFGSTRRFAARLAWPLGWVLLLVHVAWAFGVAHRWSHDEAYRHTERLSGVGAGVYVNYLYVLVWGVDVVWFVGFPRHYALRPRRVGWAVHGFLGFIAFNAAVVYSATLGRWTSLFLFGLLGWYLFRRWQRRAEFRYFGKSFSPELADRWWERPH
jgi:hypothetical protein